MRQRWWIFFPEFRGLDLRSALVTVLTYILASVLLIQVFSTPGHASETKLTEVKDLADVARGANANKVICAGLGWDEAENAPEESFACASVQPDGSFRLIERYKAILVKIFRKRMRQRKQWKARHRSILLFGAHARWGTARWGSKKRGTGTSKDGTAGAIFFRPDGTGVQAFFFDNGPDYFRSGLARYVARGKVGFIDKKGVIVIPARFRHVSPFHDGYAQYCEGCQSVKDGEHTLLEGGRWRAIDKKENPVIAPLLSRLRIDETLFRQARARGEELGCDTFCNNAKIRGLYRNACQAGSRDACLQYGKIAAELLIVDRNIWEFDTLFAGLLHSTEFHNDDAFSRNLKPRDFSLLKRHCQQNFPALCMVWGMLKFADGEEKQGEALVRVACVRDLPSACTNLGYLLDLQFRHTEAKRYYGRGCAGRDGAGCYGVAAGLYRNGAAASAKGKMDRVCAAGFKPACEVKWDRRGAYRE